MEVSPYIVAAVERAKLPTKVFASRQNGFIVGEKGDDCGGFSTECYYAADRAEAVAIYFDLCRFLQERTLPDPASASPLAGTRDGCSARSDAPEGAGL